MTPATTMGSSSIEYHVRQPVPTSVTFHLTVMKTVLYPLRRDLRLQDNPIFHALSTSKDVAFLVPLYILDPRQIEVSSLLKQGQNNPYPEARSRIAKFWRCGIHRCKFLVESLFDIKHSLRALGSDFIICAGEPGKVISSLIQQIPACDDASPVAVWIAHDPADEEKAQVRHIQDCVPSIELKVFKDESYLIHQ